MPQPDPPLHDSATTMSSSQPPQASTKSEERSDEGVSSSAKEMTTLVVDNDETRKDETEPSAVQPPSQQDQDNHSFHASLWIPILVALAAVVATLWTTKAGWRIVQEAIQWGLRATAWAAGVALGVGWSAHVYEQLDLMHSKQQEQEALHSERVDAIPIPRSNRSMLRSTSQDVPVPLVSRSSGMSASSTVSASMVNRARAHTLEDEQTYASMMQAAGYSVHPTLLRGQVVRRRRGDDDIDGDSDRYLMDRGTKAQETLDELFGQTLHPRIQTALAKWMELILRDFVVTWYSSVDKGVQYKAPPKGGSSEKEEDTGEAEDGNEGNKEAKEGSEELTTKGDSLKATTAASDELSVTTDSTAAETRDESTVNDAQATNTDSTSNPQPSSSTNSATAESTSIPQSPQLSFSRAMVYSTARQSGIPFLDALYESVGMVFGNLATRMEHVNVFDIVLLKWTKVLAHTFQAYRQLRRQLLLKAAKQYRQQQAQQRNAAVAAAEGRPSKPRSDSSPTNTATAAPPSPTGSTTSAASTSSPTRSTTANNSGGASTNETSATSTTSPKTRPTTVSEIAMAKEFILAGKLHRAITFGVDVPSLLFADASGRECGVHDDVFSQNAQQAQLYGATDTRRLTSDQVLEHRLFGTSLLRDCELDYNRVVGCRIVRALVSRNDFGSPIVASLLTEVMASCVLTPVMGLFAPDYMNGWMLSALNYASNKKKNKDKENKSAKAKGTSSSPKGVSPRPTSREPPSSTLSSVQEEASSLEKVDDNDNNNGSTDDNDNISLSELNLVAELDAAIQKVQRFVDLEQLKETTTSSGMVDTVEWEDPDCRAAVIRVVLVIEAALTHGRVVYKTIPSQNDTTTTSEASAGEATTQNEAEESDEITVERNASSKRDNKLSSSFQTASSINSSDELDNYDEDNDMEDNDYDEDDTTTTLPQLLMEMTGDLDAFEERVANENAAAAEEDESADLFANPEHSVEPFHMSHTEQSTMRTLIAAWLHTGQMSRIVTLIVQAHATILAPHFEKTAFLRSLNQTSAFVRTLQVLDQVELLVDTMMVLASPRLEHSQALISKRKKTKKNSPSKTAALAKDDLTSSSTTQDDPSGETERSSEEIKSDVSTLMSQELQQQQQMSMNASQLLLSSSIPRHFDFHRNEAFASSLRSERERRMNSWQAQFESTNNNAEEQDMMVSRSTNNEEETKIHQEMHQIARIFYNGTNLIAIRDAARRKNSSDAPLPGIDEPLSPTQSQQQPPPTQPTEELDASLPDEDLLSLLTVETACPRRRIEVPDDDSSFLLRAQPRPLTALGVHRDQRNHDQSFRCFAGTYEEPALKAGSDHFSGGRYIRRCQVRYFPIDRTASIFLQTDARKVDQRKTKSTIPESITLADPSSSTSPARQTTPFISTDFLRERHICHRWIPKGTTRTHSMLASNVMEPTDFNAQPRTGRAMDFVYRMSLFEKPMVELGDKKFTVHDSSAFGVHRADASAMEISDAALSTALLMVGDSHNNNNGDEEDAPSKAVTSSVQMGEDGYPIIWMKFSKQNETQVEVKPYRISFVRAALLLSSARQEAQLQSLVACVKNGSAKNATKALTDARLKPTQRLLYHASHRSREKQSVLLRDLKLGINHIDREQLRRNGLWNPRYPTSMKELTVCVEDALQAEEVKDANLFGATGSVYRIRCKATVELINDYDDQVSKECYGEHAHTFIEEWVVYRSFKEFQSLHKHLKNIVSPSESSGNAVTRLSASLQAGVHQTPIRKHRGVLVPSLSLASKIGTLGLTKKAMQKRREHLDGYLGYMFAPNNLLNRCPELLLFVGAFYPLPLAVKLGVCVSGLPDPLGRTKMMRTAIEEEPEVEAEEEQEDDAPASQESAAEEEEAPESTEVPRKTKKKTIYMIPAVRHKIDKVPLSQVRNRIFELLRYQFGFENASFMRNRMLAGLKTATFAVTSASEFRRTLYNMHVKHLSASAVADWIDFGLNIIFPNGAFFQPAPPLTPKELEVQREKSKDALHNGFPDAVRAILGQDLTRDGLDIVHEMLQNRIVVKSMMYMFFDLLWLEVFPEIGDVLQGGAALDIES